MKPIIIYTLPRTYSTAALDAAKREIKLNEPFDVHSLNQDLVNQVGLLAARTTVMKELDWAAIEHNLNNENAASKFFGTSLANCVNAQKWFADVDVHNTHEIFILKRPMREVAWSFILARKFGFSKIYETDTYMASLELADLLLVDDMIANFLRYFPKSGTVIEFNSLPSKYFDYDAIQQQKQFSLLKRSFMQNADMVDKQIDAILEFRNAEWTKKMGSDIFSS